MQQIFKMIVLRNAYRIRTTEPNSKILVSLFSEENVLSKTRDTFGLKSTENPPFRFLGHPVCMKILSPLCIPCEWSCINSLHPTSLLLLIYYTVDLPSWFALSGHLTIVSLFIYSPPPPKFVVQCPYRSPALYPGLQLLDCETRGEFRGGCNRRPPPLKFDRFFSSSPIYA